MEWGEFILSTLRPYAADWMVDGGWGEVAYLVRLDGDCNAQLILGQNGGLQVEGDEQEDDDGGSEGIPADALGEGLPETDESPDESDDDEEESARYGRNVRLPSVNRRLEPPVRW